MPPRLAILGLVALLALVFLRLPCQAETEATNGFCMIEPTEAALPEYSATFGDKTYHFCCSECVEMFNADPGKYIDTTEFDSNSSRSKFQRWFDGVWNRGMVTPGLWLGAAALVIMLVVRLALPKLRPLLGLPAFITMAMLALGIEAISAHLLRFKFLNEHEEEQLIHEVHASTFAEYGYPPIPAKPDVSPRLEATFYRGNDERSSQLWNHGYYRTTDIKLDLCDAEGHPISYGDTLEPEEQFFRIRVIRAPGTPDFFWTPQRMVNIFASRSPDKLLGRDGEPVPDAVPMKVVRELWEWEMLYPLAPFVETSRDGRLRGIIYHCEKRFGKDEVQIGSRFHYAYQFDLQTDAGKIADDSDLWMGATYRNRSLRIWEIPQDEWLSTEPIPVIEGKNTTTDPKLLGIEGHVLDQN